MSLLIGKENLSNGCVDDPSGENSSPEASVVSPQDVDFSKYLGELKRYNLEMIKEESFEPLDVARVERLDEVFGCGGEGYEKLIYMDRPIVTLVQQFGVRPWCQIAERSYHEAAMGPLAEVYAKEGRELLKQMGVGGPNPSLLELNTGLGSMTYSYGNAGFRLTHTVERNPVIFEWTKENWEVLRFNQKAMKWHNMDAWEFVEEMKNEVDEPFDLILADPPWRGIHGRKGNGFGFDDMIPSGRRIVPHLIQIGRVVSLKAPQVLENEEVKSLARDLGLSVKIVECILETPKRDVGEKMLFFMNRESTGGLISTETIIKVSKD